MMTRSTFQVLLVNREHLLAFVSFRVPLSKTWTCASLSTSDHDRLMDPTYDWCLSTTPQKHSNNRAYPWPRGKVLGGE